MGNIFPSGVYKRALSSDKRNMRKAPFLAFFNLKSKSFLKPAYKKKPFFISLSFLLHLSLAVVLLSLLKREKPFDHSNLKKALPSLVEVTIENKVEDKQARQIIQQKVPSLNEKTPEKTRFLGRYNQSVEEETVKQGKNVQKTQNVPTPQKETRETETPLQKQKSLASRSRKNPALNLKRFGLKKKEVFNHVYHQWKQRRKPAFVKEPENLPHPTDPTSPKSSSMKVSPEASLGTNAGTEDYIKGVKQGPETRLNSRHFVYYSYYNRIRQQVNQYWRPHIRQKLQDLALIDKYLHSDHITRLKVTLDSKGYLLNIKILKESGLREIDSVALRAFEEASPFPNPPRGLIKNDGTIHIHWSFILEI